MINRRHEPQQVQRFFARTGETRTRVRGIHVYQFELSIDDAAKPSKR